MQWVLYYYRGLYAVGIIILYYYKGLYAVGIILL